MIYTKKDIDDEICRYFTEEVSGENTDIIKKTQGLIKTILAKTDIIDACHQIRDDIVNISIDGKQVYKDKKYLPNWVKYLVYVVIYQYLRDNTHSKIRMNKEVKIKPEMSQGKLLKEMGLYPDIFGKKNWNMYSPDMKLRQAEYQAVQIPLKHAEIESNEIYRAMIHHMVCYSKVLTDTFVDMFGKLGIIPAFCAKGYNLSQTWLSLKNYRELLVFKEALKNVVCVSKYLSKLQYEIKHAEDKVSTVSRIVGIAVGKEIELMQLSEENINDAIISGDIKKNFCFDIYKFAAYFIVQQYFTPEYWVDKNLIIEKDENGEEFLTAWLKDNITKTKVDDFVNIVFYDAAKKQRDDKINNSLKALSEAYCDKRFKPLHINAKSSILQLYSETDDIYGTGDAIRDTDLLYMDVPKYLREKRKYKFGVLWYKALVTFLSCYSGDWILSWKTYIELSSSRKKENNKEKRKYKDIWYDIHSDDKICPSDCFHYESQKKDDAESSGAGYDAESNDGVDYADSDYIGDYGDDIDDDEILGLASEEDKVKSPYEILRELYEQLLEISKHRQLYVFRYRDEDRNHPNSIVFITTIDFPLSYSNGETAAEAFSEKYNFLYLYKGKLEKMEYEKFYCNVLKLY